MPETRRRPLYVADTQNAPLIPDAEVRELYAAFEEIENDGGSSNDVATMTGVGQRAPVPGGSGDGCRAR